MMNIRVSKTNGETKPYFLLDISPHKPTYHKALLEAVLKRQEYFKSGTMPGFGKYAPMERFNPQVWTTSPDPRYEGSSTTHDCLRINIRLLDSGRSYQVKAWYGEGKPLATKDAANWHLKEIHFDVKKLYEMVTAKASELLMNKVIKLGNDDIKRARKNLDLILTKELLIEERQACYKAAFSYVFAENNLMFMALKRFGRRLTEDNY